MCMLERRLQILIDEARYRRLVRAARERNQSVSAVIRDAIDQALPSDLAKKQAALDALLTADPIPVPAAVDELKTELADARGRVA